MGNNFISVLYNPFLSFKSFLIMHFFQETKASQITVQRSARGKKSVTVIKNLSTHGIDVKQAAKFFASKFACGSSATAPDEIVIQGDVKDELFDIIPEKWTHIDEESIVDLGDVKR